MHLMVSSNISITVCLASYNGSEYIRVQLDSILKQLPSSAEVIISDDGSTDSTVAVINKIPDPRIKLLTGNKFSSPVLNFQNALQYATGEYIFLSDQDDVWLPDKVKIMTEALENGAQLVISDARIVDENLNVIHDSFFAARDSHTGFLKNLLKNRFAGCTMAFRADLLKKALPFPEKIHMHDWWLNLVAHLTGRVEMIEKPLILYRRHGANASETGEKSSSSAIEKIMRRLYLLYCSLRRVYLGR